MTTAAECLTGVAPAPGGRRRLLLGVGDDLDRHATQHGPRRLHGPALIDEIARSGLTGRGGAAFPVATKLTVARDAMTRGRRSVVIANAAEGEPLSRKDAVLLSEAPHLVLDGLAAIASAVGATETYVYASAALAPRIRAVVALRVERGWDRTAPVVVDAPDRFVAGETTAVVDGVAGGPGLPHDRRVPTAVRGLRGRPTVVQNVETLAHVALIDRHGADWFRERGTRSEPGSMLVTVSDDHGIRGVAECDLGSSLSALVDRGARAVLIGGFHGTWVDGRDVGSLAMSTRSLRAVGASPGAGIVRSVSAGTCGLAVTADIIDHLAAESAGQCGPCVFGLPALAGAFRDLCDHGGADRVQTVARLAATVDGRGACAHPDGTARLVRSALRVFADDIHHHTAGRCAAHTPRGPQKPRGHR
jgi:NADH:ubiquinone oxidoreductase subunit F (NADH-binding)